MKLQVFENCFTFYNEFTTLGFVKVYQYFFWQCTNICNVESAKIKGRIS